MDSHRTSQRSRAWTTSSPRPTRHPPTPEDGTVMTTPRTELDTRFSGPAAQPTSWENTLEAIKQAGIFWISTVRTDGRPHVTPLVAIWLDDALHFSTGPDEQKARNLASNPRVALTTGTNDWESGLDVVVEGQAVRVTDAQQLDRLAAAWAQ